MASVTLAIIEIRFLNAAVSKVADAPVGPRNAATNTSVSNTNFTSYMISEM